MIGVPSAPNATGAVFAISASPAAYNGGNPVADERRRRNRHRRAKPGRPLDERPKAKRDQQRLDPLIGRQCRDRAFTFSNSPVSTVSTYKKHGRKHDPADWETAQSTPRSPPPPRPIAGIPYTPIATTSAVVRPTAAALAPTSRVIPESPVPQMTGARRQQRGQNF